MVTVKKFNEISMQNGEALKSNNSNEQILHLQENVKVDTSEHLNHSNSDACPQLNGVTESDGKWHEKFVGRSKDLLSSETSGIATAAAIVVGAALIEVELIPGLIIGAGAILLGKLFPEMKGYMRPAIKGIVSAGYSMTHKTRQIIAEANEQVNDLIAEVKHEQEQPMTQAHAPVASQSIVKDLPTH